MFILLLGIQTLFAQRTCASSFDLEELQNRIPRLSEVFMQIENQRTTSFRSAATTDDVVIILVVVHILHNGEKEGKGLNISFEQVKSQIDVLNEDFRGLNEDRANTPDFFTSV